MLKRGSFVACVSVLALLALALAASVASAPPVTVGGTVKGVSEDGKQITVVVGTGKAAKEQTLRLTAATKITLDGKSAKSDEIAEGTKVTLSYDKATSEVVAIRATTPKAEPAEKAKDDAPAESPPAAGKSGRTSKSNVRSDTSNAASAGEWPQWRGPDRNGVSKDTGLLKQWPQDGPPLAWTANEMGGGFGSVAVTGGRIYVTGDRGGGQNVSCVNASDGTIIWATPIGKPADGARSTPTVDGDLLFALSSRGNQDAEIVCLETATGKEQWRKNFRSDFNGRMMSNWGYSESPLVDGDHVICTPGGSDATLVALKKKTGDVVWKAKVPGGDAAGYASAVVAEVGGVRQYVQLLEKGIVGVAAKDGKFLWRYDKIANGTANIPTPIVRGDLVFCSTGYNTGAALLKLTAGGGGVRMEEKYFIPANQFQNHHGGMVLIGDYIYAGSGHNNGLPACIDLKSGKLAWGPQRGPGEKSAAIAYADGHLYFRYENAVMALIEASPKGYKAKGSFKIPNGQQPSWSHPVVAGGRLYLRDQDRLLCYDVRADRSTARAD
jgi:outer membrane protein assembly factor BamB